MKRFLVSILMTLYMAGAMGATVHLHYCMGHFVGASLLHHEEHKCGRCGMVKKVDSNGCCKDEYKTFKTAEHNNVNPSVSYIHQAVAIPFSGTLYTGYAPVYYGYATRPTVQAHAPPGKWPAVPVYIQIRNLRV